MWFKGWTVLGSGFINAMLIAGAAVYSFGLFVIPIQEEFALSREQVNIGIMVLYLSLMIWAPIIGRWLQKWPAKRISIMGAIGFGLGSIMIAYAPTPFMLVLAVGLLLGFGFTAAGPFLENVLAANWFHKYRGRALGISAIATSAGGLVVVPLFAVLITQFGWREATLYYGVTIALIVLLISHFFIVGKPQELGLFPDGSNEVPIVDTKDRNIAFAKSRGFWCLALGAGLLLGSDQALLISLIPHAQGNGISREAAALLMSAITGSAIIGKLAVGWLAERWDKRQLFAAVCVMNLIFLLALIISPPYVTLLLICAIVGLAIGGVYPVWTSLTAELFGSQAFSKVYGTMNLITIPLMLISITIAGRTFDSTGNYDLAFKIFIPQVILAAIFVFLIPSKTKP